MKQYIWSGICYIVTGVTILLSQTVFRLLVGHVITKTSDAVPLLGRSKWNKKHSRIYTVKIKPKKLMK